jgi:hypothetical protein
MAQPLRFIEPMLPTLASVAPEGDEWLHEIKYGGFRTQLIFEPSGVRAFTKRGIDWTARYATLVTAARELKGTLAIIDGEMIVQDSDGRSDFDGFGEALRNRPERLVFMAFDLLHLDGRDFATERLIDRREALQGLIGESDPGSPIQLSEHMVGCGGAMLKAAAQLGLEGIVSKQVLSRYRSGRSEQWLKIKCWPVDRFVVLGLEPGSDGPPMAQLARETAHGLVPAGWAAAPMAAPVGDQYWDDVDQLALGETPPAGPNADRTTTPALPMSAQSLQQGQALRRASQSSSGDFNGPRSRSGTSSSVAERRAAAADRRSAAGTPNIGSAPVNMLILTVLIVLLLALLAEL